MQAVQKLDVQYEAHAMLRIVRLVQVAVEADNSFREFEFNLESGPRVGAQWTPVPRRINLVPETAGGKNRAGRGDLGAETRFRRQMPCVSLSVPERASSLRGHGPVRLSICPMSVCRIFLRVHLYT